MPYSSYDHDKLETAETMRIERRIYFEAKDGEIAPYVSLPLEQLQMCIRDRILPPCRTFERTGYQGIAEQHAVH